MPHEEAYNRRLALIEEAIGEHGAYLQAYLYKLTNNQHDAEDLFNELWVAVLNNFPEDKITDLSHLSRKTYTQFVDWWRKKRRRNKLVTTVEEVPEIAVPAMTAEPSTAEEAAAFAKSFFEEYPVDLTDDQKQALLLSARYGYTHVEIGQIMKKAPSTVGDLIKQARSAFTVYLNQS